MPSGLDAYVVEFSRHPALTGVVSGDASDPAFPRRRYSETTLTMLSRGLNADYGGSAERVLTGGSALRLETGRE